VQFEVLPLLRRARGLLVLPELGCTAPLRQLIALLAALAGDRSEESVAAYGGLFRALAACAVSAGEQWPASGDQALATALADALLTNETWFSRWAERGGQPAVAGLPIHPNPSGWGRPAALPDQTVAAGFPAAAVLYRAAAADLRVLQALAAAGQELPAAVARLAGQTQPLPWWDGWSAESGDSPESAGSAGFVGSAGSAEPDEAVGGAGSTNGARAWWVEEGDRGRWTVVERLVGADDWGTLVEILAAYFATHGGGLLAHYRAFRWLGAGGLPPGPATELDDEAGGGRGGALMNQGSTLAGFVPVPAPDSVRPNDLIGYAAERELLRRNTVHFLAGYPANNVLLYGDRGTGKSSSVKALLHEQARPEEPPGLWQQLRIVEVPKAHLAEFPALAELLRGRPQRFVVFVDDLSFEEGETHYKDVKAMLEGGLEARPANVVVYATSNRRHLVREHFADRASPDSDEVHAQDTVQEKLSFADRFGLTITFPSPDQAAYLAIVEGLAQQRHLAVEPAALRARAIEWAAWHNGRSGRTARQFVDYLAAELGLAGERRKTEVE